MVHRFEVLTERICRTPLECGDLSRLWVSIRSKRLENLHLLPARSKPKAVTGPRTPKGHRTTFPRITNDMAGDSPESTREFPLVTLLRLWFGVTRPVTRSTYALSG